MNTIERSPGLPTGLGFVAGGGVTGATVELDILVQEAADLLAKSYGLPVVIRFNSDRRSGGAWLKTDDPDGFGLNAEIGIGGYLVDARTNEKRRRYEMPEIAEGVYVTAHIGRRALATPEIANSSGYYHDVQESLSAALDFVRAHGSLDFLS